MIHVSDSVGQYVDILSHIQKEEICELPLVQIRINNLKKVSQKSTLSNPFNILNQINCC